MMKLFGAGVYFKKVSSHFLFPIAVSGMLGMLLCVSIYGVRIMNPSNTEWLYANGDISQHQIGWDFFREDTWRLPLGKIGNLAYPEGTSLVYMDSIPIAAIFAKIFSPILPQQFQYFGLWGLMCFFLQGALSASIFSRFTKNRLHIILGSILIVLMPIFLMRTYAHTALASQWVVLLGLGLIVYKEKLRTSWHSIGVWSFLTGLSVAIHPYFLPMNLILLIVYLVLSKTSLHKSLLHLIIAGGGSIAVFWIMGGFVTKDVGTSTLGMFGADINALINPINFSYFVQPLPTIAGGYEGLAYMGLGIYMLTLIVVAHWLMSIQSFSDLYKKLKVSVASDSRHFVVFLIIIASIVLAVGPVWYLNGNQIVVLSLPDPLANLLSIFRSTGRFIWIACYIIAFAVIVWIIRRVGVSKVTVFGATLLLVIAVSVQYIDVSRSQGMRQKAMTIKTHMTQQNRFKTSDVRKLLQDKKYVSYVANTLHDNDFFELGPLVAHAGLMINDGYISRKPAASVNRETEQAFQELSTGALRTDTIYVTNDYEDTLWVQNNPHIKLIRIDHTWLISTN